MVRFISLSSGSNGNCYYVGNGEAAFLIDMGIGGRTVKKRLATKEIDIESVQFVLVTHDHVDHIKYLGGFTERFKRPIFATPLIHSSLENHFCTRGHMCGCIRDITPGEATEAVGVRFTPFIVPHDATQTVGYYIEFSGTSFTFITDVGDVTDDVIKYCRMAEHLIVESNYDYDMLLGGSYTPELKLRIMRGHGHLSNEQTAHLLRSVAHPGLKSVFLCHLSENNNTHEKAEASAREALDSVGMTDVLLAALPRRCASEIFEF